VTRAPLATLAPPPGTTSGTFVFTTPLLAGTVVVVDDVVLVGDSPGAPEGTGVPAGTSPAGTVVAEPTLCVLDDCSFVTAGADTAGVGCEFVVETAHAPAAPTSPAMATSVPIFDALVLSTSTISVIVGNDFERPRIRWIWISDQRVDA